MRHTLDVFSALVAAGLLSTALCAPAPQLNYHENTGAVGGVSPGPTATATATSGALYGDESLLGGGSDAAPSPISGGDSAVVPESDFELVNGQDADADLGLYLDFNSVKNPQPLRGGLGATDPGPRTYAYEKLNPDVFAPPGTDSGSIPQVMWPLGLSHNRLGSDKGSGWARQQNQAVLPAASAMAGVDMRLAPHAYRELHWHTANEWSLVLKGCVRLAAVDQDGQSFIDDICAGDVWFFPAGVPHSIQALEEGSEFLLVFDQGDFNEDGTFLASELFLRNPKEVLSKNFHTPVDSFDKIPTGELYIFNGTPAPADIQKQNITGPAGPLPISDSYTYHFSQQAPYTVPGGSVKIIDPTTFPIASMFSAALVTLQPGAIREIHWHLDSDEWSYFLQGSARVTVFLAPTSSGTFDFTAGDVGYIPAANSHYVENTGTEDVIFLEVLQSKKFTDISVAQWLALTPSQVVKDTLHLPDSLIESLPKDKPLIRTGNPNLTALAGGGSAY